MHIDKQNGNIAFSENTHTYFDVTDSSKHYTSVTTLIHKYTQEFDSEFWSIYKALERILPKNDWEIEKRSLQKTHKFDPAILPLYGIAQEELDKVQQDILGEWKRKNEESCARGTKIHADIENSFYKKKKDIDVSKFGVGGKFVCKKDYYELDLDYGIYPEYLVHNDSEDGKLFVAGQIDLIIKNGNEITLCDWKSNNKIDKKGGYDTVNKRTYKMKYPLNNLDDANFWHYTLQLSTYAWMLQKINPKFIIKDLILCHYGHDGSETIYHCDYLKSDVERMLADYKKSLVIEEKRNKRKRIEY